MILLQAITAGEFVEEPSELIVLQWYAASCLMRLFSDWRMLSDAGLMQDRVVSAHKLGAEC